jgi:hypothetical protein
MAKVGLDFSALVSRRPLAPVLSGWAVAGAASGGGGSRGRTFPLDLLAGWQAAPEPNRPSKTTKNNKRAPSSRSRYRMMLGALAIQKLTHSVAPTAASGAASDGIVRGRPRARLGAAH